LLGKHNVLPQADRGEFLKAFEENGRRKKAMSEKSIRGGSAGERATFPRLEERTLRKSSVERLHAIKKALMRGEKSVHGSIGGRGEGSGHQHREAQQ